MRNSKYIKPFVLSLAAAALLAGCTKNATNTDRADVTYTGLSMASVQVYNVTIGSQRTFVYVDGKPVNGAALLYTNATYTPLFPASGSAFAVQPGVRPFLIRDTLATSTQPQLSFPQSFDPSKHYVIFTYDTLTAIKQKVVETPIEKVNDSTSRLRLANFAFTPGGNTPAIDVYSKRLKANVFTEVAYTDVSPFVSYASSISSTSLADTLLVRQAGNTVTNLDTLVINPAGRTSYTLVFRGRYATNGAAGGTYPRTLSIFSNY